MLEYQEVKIFWSFLAERRYLSNLACLFLESSDLLKINRALILSRLALEAMKSIVVL